MKTLLTSISTLILLSTTAFGQSATEASRPGGTGVTAGTSSTTSPDATTAARTPVAADYRLVPGDKLRVEVYGDPQASQSLQVRPDGKITLPLANDIMAAGRTPIELRDAITSSLKPFISNPTVTVIVQETVPPVVYVMGEVNNAGPQPMVGRLDVLQALSAAGGFKDFANTKNIRIRRGSQILKFNYNEAVKSNAAPLFLQPGDTVIVP